MYGVLSQPYTTNHTVYIVFQGIHCAVPLICMAAMVQTRYDVTLAASFVTLCTHQYVGTYVSILSGGGGGGGGFSPPP